MLLILFVSVVTANIVSLKGSKNFNQVLLGHIKLNSALACEDPDKYECITTESWDTDCECDPTETADVSGTTYYIMDCWVNNETGKYDSDESCETETYLNCFNESYIIKNTCSE